MQPNLIHPIPVTIEVLDRSATRMDPDAREPIRGARAVGTKKVVVQAQVRWTTKDNPTPAPSGQRYTSLGSITVRRADVAALGVTLKPGDRITLIGCGALAQTVDLYLTSETPMGHWPDQGGATLSRWDFDDGGPGKRAPGAR